MTHTRYSRYHNTLLKICKTLTIYARDVYEHEQLSKQKVQFILFTPKSTHKKI